MSSRAQRDLSVVRVQRHAGMKVVSELPRRTSLREKVSGDVSRTLLRQVFDILSDTVLPFMEWL